MGSMIDIKHGVYLLSNTLCNPPLNIGFRVQCMKVGYERVLQRAKELGMPGPKALADALNISPQNMTNWKIRGVPPRMHKPVADVLQWSVDELLGRGKVDKAASHSPFRVPFSDYLGLTTKQKQELAEIVEDRIARFRAKGGPTGRKEAKRAAA